MQACGKRKSLFADRLDFNLISDMPGAFMNKLEERAAARLREQPIGDAPSAAQHNLGLEQATNAADDLETPRGSCEVGLFDEDADAAKAVKERKKRDMFLTGGPQANEHALDCSRLGLPVRELLQPFSVHTGMCQPAYSGLNCANIAIQCKQASQMLYRAWVPCCEAEVAPAVLDKIADCCDELRRQWSPKFMVVHCLLRFCQARGEKLVIFSENIASLSTLEGLLQVRPCLLPMLIHSL